MSSLPIVAAGQPAPGARPIPRSSDSPPPGAPGTELRDEDLHDLLTAFYDAVARDAMLAPYFAAVDMTEHMPRIVAFWSTLLFHTGRYGGNAFRVHQQMPGLTAEHFARWLAVLEATVDARCTGEHAERMKALAHRIAYSMQLRLGITPLEGLRAL